MTSSLTDTQAVPRRKPTAERDGEFGPGLDRAMLEWARRRPDDGFVVGVALRLRGPKPSPQRIADLVRDRLPLLPALAEHLDGPPGQERWSRFGSFDPAHHVHALDLGSASSRPAVELLANTPVWEDRPRWGLWVTDTQREDEYLLTYRVHHAAQDGLAITHTLGGLFDARFPAAPATEAGGAGTWATGPPGTGDRLLAVADVSYDAMRAIAKAEGTTLHDVYLGALAGALRSWPAPAGRSGCAPVPVRVPFSVRLPSERQDRGNRVGHARVFLPVDEPDARRRLAGVVAQTGRWERERTRRVLDRMPARMLDEQIAGSPDPGDALACATSMRIRPALAFDGSPVTGAVALPPLSAGHLFTSVLCVHGSRATVAFTARQADQHVRELPRLWEQEVARLATATSH
ncbi:hypothetical protein [Kitasatospora sp. NPDC058218]|uniref:hypothetical protein n=1 Tax=Kitasatospora sp. NPDC058218 TaxID=3346385 RepID=UPI0036DA737E